MDKDRSKDLQTSSIYPQMSLPVLILTNLFPIKTRRNTNLISDMSEMGHSRGHNDRGHDVIMYKCGKGNPHL